MQLNWHCNAVYTNFKAIIAAFGGMESLYMSNIDNNYRSATANADTALLRSLYGDKTESRRRRLDELAESFCSFFGCDDTPALFSVPGRSELSGNHTDHNLGRVIAASVDLDIIAAAVPRTDGVIRLKSEGFPEDVVDIESYTAPNPCDFGHSSALIAGMVAGFRKNGYAVGGFDAYTSSNVLKGSGLSSSAAFEVMIGNILNHLFNDGKIDNVEIAKLAQFSENQFFGKPCGLMDQMACAVGGIVAIDFADPASPSIEKPNFDIDSCDYKLCIVDTGGNHADLTDDYASVPAEMKAVAGYFGKKVLREINEEDVISAIPELRKKLGDRAVLRAMHYYAENHRVTEQTKALKDGDFDRFLEGVTASGRSSFCYLQNAYSNKDISCQGLPLALCLCEKYLANCKGAWRLHGGGFAGTIQAFVPTQNASDFAEKLEAVFGSGSCYILRVRPYGAVRIV